MGDRNKDIENKANQISTNADVLRPTLEGLRRPLEELTSHMLNIENKDVEHQGLFFVCYSDGEELEKIDKKGNYIRYRANGPVLFVGDPEMHDIYYRRDGKTVDYIIDENDNVLFYREDGKTVEAIKDKEGNIVYYRNDGKTIEAVEDKDGNIVYYKNDGKTVDYVGHGNDDKNDMSRRRLKETMRTDWTKSSDMCCEYGDSYYGWVMSRDDDILKKNKTNQRKANQKKGHQAKNQQSSQTNSDRKKRRAVRPSGRSR